MGLEHCILLAIRILTLRDGFALTQWTISNYGIDVFPDYFTLEIDLIECATLPPSHQCVAIL